MKLAPGTIIRADAFLFDMDGTLVDSTDAIERVWTRWALHHDLIPSQVLSALYGVRIADTVRALAPRGSDIMQRSLSFFRRNTRKSMESCPWPVRANCWNACRVTDGLLSPQPTEVCRKPECISPACQERRYSLPLKTSRRESPSPMVTGSPPKILVWIAKQRSCSKIQTPVFWRAGTPAAGDCRHGDPRYAGPRSNRLDLKLCVDFSRMHRSRRITSCHVILSAKARGFRFQ